MSRMFGAAVVVGVAFMIAGCQQATGQEPLMDASIGETTAVFAEEGFAPFDARRTIMMWFEIVDEGMFVSWLWP